MMIQFSRSITHVARLLIALTSLGAICTAALAQGSEAARTSPVAAQKTTPLKPLQTNSTDKTAAAPLALSKDPVFNDEDMAAPSMIGDDYKIAANDLLEIEVFGVKELKRTVRVNSSGYITMPLIGPLQVAGLNGPDVEALIAISYGKEYLQDPQISVFIKEFTTQRITLDGAVVKPGIYPLTGQITLLRALALGGGGSQLADLEQVMIFRLTPGGESVVEKYNVEKIRKGEEKDPLLQGEDVVVVNRNTARTALRDSLFRDILDTLNPFSASVNNVK